MTPFWIFFICKIIDWCNVCSVTRIVVLVVMLAGYLPEMQSKHLIKLIMMIGIVNFSSEFTARFFYRFDLTRLTIQPVGLIQGLFSNDLLRQLRGFDRPNPICGILPNLPDLFKVGIDIIRNKYLK